MIRLLLALLRPLATIAQELRLIRELYEAELEARVVPMHGVQAPVRRLTEKPKESDTEVLMPGERRPPRFKLWDVQAEDEELED